MLSAIPDDNALYPDEHRLAARLNHNTGICLGELGKFQQAIDRFKAAEKEYLVENSRDSLLGELYLNLGEIFLYLNADSVFFYADKIPAVFGPDKVIAGRALSLRAFMEIYKEDYGAAKKHFEAAKEIFKRLLPENAFEYSDFYAKYADYCRRIGDLYNLELYSKQALNIFLMYKPLDHVHALGLINEYATYFKNTGKFGQAIEHFQMAIDFLLRNFGPEDFRLASVYNNIGSCYYEQQNFKKSLVYFLKSLEIRKKGSNKGILGIQHIQVGFNYQALGDSINATEYFHLASHILDSLHESPPSIHRARIKYGFGWIAETNGKLSETKAYYEAALGELGIVADKDDFPVPFFSRSSNMLNILTSLAKVNYKIYLRYSDFKSLTDAFKIYRRAIEVLDEMKDYYDDPNSRLELIGQSTKLFEGAIEASLALYEKTKDKSYFNFAFRVAEKSKNYLLLDVIKSRKMLELSAVPDSLIALSAALRKKAGNLEEELFLNKDTTMESVERMLFQVREKLAETQDRIHGLTKKFNDAKHPEDYVMLYLSLRQNSKKWVIEYFTGTQHIYAFVFSRDSFFVKQIPRDFSLEETVKKFRSGLFLPYTQTGSKERISNQQATEYMIENGIKLFDKLVRPLGKLPDHLTIVPDGILGSIPFDVLLKGQPEDQLNFLTYPFLINECSISYSYSVSLLQEMVQKQNAGTGGQKILAMAPFYHQGLKELEQQLGRDPENGNVFSERSVIPGETKTLSELTSSGEECYIAWKLLGGEIELGKEATKQKFLELAPKYGILHLSTHAEANNNDGDFSFLAFAPEAEQTSHQPLFVNELYYLQLHADLVTLSGCETGIGEVKGGEGIISLARAFAYAGTKSILTTLWKANDEASKELLKYFYLELKRGEPKDKALRAAKQQYLKDQKGEASHPFFWAGFIAIGDMSPIR
ncbi:MAG: CHAT domain-containing protein [Lewinellaceae bacterium]|nr:CHAT domain-containing protein [Lewinella sp.]MCB9277456.1 CHAT domain-containing protein [Lewinellaceae bacterium]